MTGIRPLALVTGASSGIGEELAKLFVADGFDLVVVAETDEVNAAAHTLEMPGSTVTPVQADLRTTDGVRATVAAVETTDRP